MNPGEGDVRQQEQRGNGIVDDVTQAVELDRVDEAARPIDPDVAVQECVRQQHVVEERGLGDVRGQARESDRDQAERTRADERPERTPRVGCGHGGAILTPAPFSFR